MNRLILHHHRRLSLLALALLALALRGAYADDAPPMAQPNAAVDAFVADSGSDTPAADEAGLHDDPYAMLDDEAFTDADAELLSLDLGMVVTAARREQPIRDIPYAISVITAEDIRRSGARSVPDALRLVPGVDVAELNYGQAAVSPRGYHGYIARETLVLVDGRQIFDSLFGGTIWGAWPFMLEDIERIEVVRGPGVTWGANAMNGVINIITKDPRDQLGLTMRGGGGNRGVHREYLGYAFSGENFRMRVSGEYENSEGFLRGGHPLRPLQDEFRSGRFGVHGIFELSDQDTFTLSAGSGLTDGGFPPGISAGLRTGPRGAQTNYALFRLSHAVEADNRIDVTLYANDFGIHTGSPLFEYRYQQVALQFGHSFKPNDEHTITYGIDTRLDMLNGQLAHPDYTSIPYVTTAIVGLYGQDEWRFAPRWTATLGARIDYDAYGGFEPSGRASLAYQINNQSLVYGAISRAFQMPPGAGRLIDTVIAEGLLHLKTDEHNATAKLWAYEVGYRTELFERLRLSATAFWHEQYDHTVSAIRFGPPYGVYASTASRANASLYGVELDARYPVNELLTLLGNYTYQEFAFDAAEEVFAADRMEPPRHKFMVGARYSATDDIHLASHLYFVDATRAPGQLAPLETLDIDPYFRLDLNAEFEFWEDRAALSFGVKNLLDDHHYEGASSYVNSAQVPRMYFAQLRIHVD